MRDRDRFHAEEDDDLVKRREVSDEMRKDSWYAGDKLSVDHPDSLDSDNSEVWGAEECEEPVDWDFVLDVKFVTLKGSVVPNVHDEEEDEGEGDWNPSTFEEFNEWSWEVENFDCSEKENEGKRVEGAFAPA